MYVTNAIPSLLNARTIEIWAEVLFAGSTWACVKTLCSAMVKLRPDASMDFMALETLESRMTCEHCRCRLLMTKLWEDALLGLLGC